MAYDPDSSFDRPVRYRRDPGASGCGGVALALLVGGAVGVGLLYALGPKLGRFQADPLNPAEPPREAVPASAPDSEEKRAIDLFKGAKGSVVNVDTVLRVRNRLGTQVQDQQAGTGSGFVWDADGRVVTNFHVIRQTFVDERLTIRVVFPDRTAYPARLVGAAPDFDLAVLQVAAPKDKLQPIRVGTSADLQVGQKAFAIGNPFGLSLSMTQGVISALDREIESPGGQAITGAIQTDAPINPGNSGGPLLDRDGRLIGVNTSIATAPGGGGNVGIGFAIPVDTVNEVVTQIIRTGKVQKPDLGVTLVDQVRLRRAGYPTGVMVRSAAGPAAAAGLRGLTVNRRTGEVEEVGDLILAINGQEVGGNQEFLRLVAGLKIGSTAKLTVERDGDRRDVDVTVGGV